jgi:hypothetical protein
VARHVHGLCYYPHEYPCGYERISREVVRLVQPSRRLNVVPWLALARVTLPRHHLLRARSLPGKPVSTPPWWAKLETHKSDWSLVCRRYAAHACCCTTSLASEVHLVQRILFIASGTCRGGKHGLLRSPFFAREQLTGYLPQSLCHLLQAIIVLSPHAPKRCPHHVSAALSFCSLALLWQA